MSAPAPLRVLGEALGEGAGWLVGGAVRDRLLGRVTTDFDVVVGGDAARLARVVGRGAGGHAFALSDAFGAWRVVARDHSWQLDLLALGDATIEEDLSRRDLTVNAIAEPLGGDGRLLDPYGGAEDLAARRLTMVSEASFLADPLRVMRLARLTAQLGFTATPATLARARESAPGLGAVAPERVFAELRALLLGPAPLNGLALMDALGATAAVLPELAALDGVEQSAYHDRDVGGHTRAVLAETVGLLADPDGPLELPEASAAALSAALAEPLANELTRGEALRVAALLHDIAKPRTRGETESGRVTFIGHDVLGAEMSREILGRLRCSERLRAHVATLTRHHLDLGFLVHRVPLSRREVYDYLQTCAPVGVDVTVLSVADRLATRGRGAPEAIQRHLALARVMIGEALAFEAAPPRPPIRGDALAVALGIPAGPRIGALLAELTAASFTGEVHDADGAAVFARRLLEGNQRSVDGPGSSGLVH